MSAKHDDGLRATLAKLLKTPVPVLRKRYAATGKDPKGLSRDELVKALVGTSEATAPKPVATKPASKQAAPTKPTAPRTRSTKPRDPRLPPAGTTLTREYKGKVYKIEVLERGFRYDGREWRSLTGIALAITGYKAISGTLFFGVAQRKDAAPTSTPDAPAKAQRAPKAPAPKRKRGSRS